MPTSTIKIKAGDTDPLQLSEISAAGQANLDNVTSIAAYFREEGASENHVDGATVGSIDSGAGTAEFDPVGAKKGGGNAFDAAGKYVGYLSITWTSGRVTRHPNDGDLVVRVAANLE